jgi:hypothetical protein
MALCVGASDPELMTCFFVWKISSVSTLDLALWQVQFHLMKDFELNSGYHWLKTLWKSLFYGANKHGWRPCVELTNITLDSNYSSMYQHYSPENLTIQSNRDMHFGQTPTLYEKHDFHKNYQLQQAMSIKLPWMFDGCHADRMCQLPSTARSSSKVELWPMGQVPVTWK